MSGVVFERGDRVTLRTIEREDTEFLQRGRNHPEVAGPLGMPFPENEIQIEESIEEWIEGDDSVNLFVCLDSEDADGTEGDGDTKSDEDNSESDEDSTETTPIGMVNVMKLHWDRPLLSYWLLPDYQGEGYATEAMTVLLDYFFDSHYKRGVQARVFSHNEPSQALLERLGFEQEAALRDHVFVEGAYRDELVFGLLREEWIGE
ncbi:GNAT family N-acetyltransferase [Halorussus halophilus]|uniref:GNAT family N-acetyltransferase n=1 Tax=Halorussus halophilus TaxID=2650975 RepID=UPI001301216B|nr:GNAT family protein [Halorussus halophilus]